ncbi:hypothetical protein ABZ746_23710 [Streptomyces sp. NPDC020096]
MKLGVFRTAHRVELPEIFAPVLPTWLLVSLVRYTDGPLHYDEFAFGSLARRGRRLGMHVHEVWVNDRSSQEAGQRHWGLDKRMATFQWDDAQVTVTSDSGTTVCLAAPHTPGPALPLVLPFPVFGRNDRHLLFGTAAVHAGARTAALSITRWPAEFPALARPASSVGLHAARFTATIPASRPIADLS